MLSSVTRRFRELRRRRVFHVAGVYAVVAWVVVQVAVVTFPHLGLPGWLITAVIVLAVLGFPLALVLAWALEVTPEGVRRQRGAHAASDERAAPEGTPRTGRRPRLAFLVLVVAGLATVGGLAYRRGNATAEPVAPTPFAAFALSQLTFSEAVEEFPAFSPDGRFMVFSREAAGLPRQLFLKELETGDEVQLTNAPADHIQATFSPDGATLLFVRSTKPEKLQPIDVFQHYQSGGGIWRMELATRRAEALIDDAFGPGYAPDGRRIAFDAAWSGVHRIWTADAWGRNPQMATADPSDVVVHSGGRWSPDGRRIAFQHIEKMKQGIRVLDVETGRITALTDDDPRDVDPVWLSDGELLFASYRGGGLNLWRIRVTADGEPAGPPLQLTTGAGQDLQPAVAPDGRIAFVTMNQNADIWRLPVDPASGRPTGPPQAVVTTTREDSRGVVSPDGRLLAFNSDRAGDMNLWLLDLEEGRVRQLTRGAGGDYQARWSPDGRRLAFFSSRAGNADIWEVDVLTGALRQLTSDPGVDVNPFYSHDGTRIAFQSDRGGGKDVWVMDSNGVGQRQLTHTGASDHYMAWTADDAWIVYHGPGGGGAGMRMVSVATGETRPHPPIRGGGHFTYSPDFGRMADTSLHLRLFISPLAAGEAEVVLEFDDPDVRIDYPSWSPDGRWIVFDRLKPTGGDIWLLTPAPAR
jgi:Tol biopolymer transport system component